MLANCSRRLATRVEGDLGHRVPLYRRTVAQKVVDSDERLNDEQIPGPGGKNSKSGGSSGSRMRSWELHSYGGPAELQLSTAAKIPPIKTPYDVLVRVMASSVNPIDVGMSQGYGAGAINTMRALDKGTCTNGLPKLWTGTGATAIEFPLTLGRDFAGIVAELGHGVEGLTVGDEVYGVLGVQRSGCHAEFVVAAEDTVKKKPKNLSFVQAASIPYVGLTAWSAIRVTGALQNLSGRNFLVLGGSGGVGTFTIQYLKANEGKVVTTCSPDASELLDRLGADFIIEKNGPTFESSVQSRAPYDCILDFSGQFRQPELYKYLKPRVGQYITLSPPFLSNTDKYGTFGGFVWSFGSIVSENLKSIRNEGVITKWALFVPSGPALESITTLIEAQKIRPVIQETFKFDSLREAYERLDQGHARGKIMVDFT